MTCKDCIKNDVCEMYHHLCGEQDVEKRCKHIKDKSTCAEIVYAEWVDKYNNKYHNHLYVCSNCGGKALYGFYQNELDQTKEQQILSTGCPHCCARMRNAIGGVKE